MIALMAGCLLDFMIGDPHGIWHPVIAIGKLISFLERKLLPAGDHLLSDGAEPRDQGKELRRGIFTVVIVLLLTGVAVSIVLIGAFFIHPYLGAGIEAILTCYILAARSLSKESKKVYDDLAADDLIRARRDLSMIVGRDVEHLEKDAIIRATVETVAENTSDGVIAPLIYTAIGGPILGMIYKAVNTMDSMIGYNNDRYRFFGRVAAKLDDVLNFLPARIGALFMVASAGILGLLDGVYSAGRAFLIWRRDRRKHLSPNSAQTESTCAGALGIRLGGASSYGGVLVEKPYLGEALRDIENQDIIRAGRLMYLSEALMLILMLMIWTGIFLLVLME